MAETKITQGESNIFPRIWTASAVNTVGFTVGSPAFTAVQVTDLLISGVTVPTAMVIEALSTVVLDRATGGIEQDISLSYRVNGGAWTTFSAPVNDYIAYATMNFTNANAMGVLSVTPGNTYDFRTNFICQATGVTQTVRQRFLTVKTFLAG